MVFCELKSRETSVLLRFNVFGALYSFFCIPKDGRHVITAKISFARSLSPEIQKAEFALFIHSFIHRKRKPNQSLNIKTKGSTCDKMCNGDADGEELPQVTTNHHQVNDGKRGKPDDISDVQEKVKVEPWSPEVKIEKKGQASSKNVQPKEQGSANAAQYHEKPVRRAENTNNKEKYKSR